MAKMKERIFWSVLLMATIILTPFVAFGAMARSADLATAAVGSQNYAWGIGIATVISRYTPIAVRVQPYAGPPAWLPSMDRGETDMGVLTGPDSLTSYRGILIYKRPFRNTRILIVGGTLTLSFYVAKEASMTSVADLRGKRVPTDFPATPIVKLSSTAALAASGLTYDDIVKVPVSDLQAGAQAFLEGRTDAGWHTVGSPAVEEANARKGGVKFVSVISTTEGARKMAEVYPGSYPRVLKTGSATAIIKDTAFLTSDYYLVGSKDLSDETVYEVIKALWEYNQELGAAYATLKEWQRDRMVSDKAFIPYHSGAIKFFREKGIWTKELEALQAKLLGQ